MESLADKIRLAKDGDEKAMLDIIERFEPLIGKYTRLLNYDNEDCRSDLIEKLITLVKVEIDLGKLRSDNDGALFNYIRFALRHHYILLSKANQKIRDNEAIYDQETFVDMVEDKLQYSYTDTEWGITLDMMRETLTEREFIYIKLIVIDGYTAESVSKRFGVTKQSVNQCKNRGLEKLKKIYI